MYVLVGLKPAQIGLPTFKKDLKRAKCRGKAPKKLQHIIGKLVFNEPLDKRKRLHGLSGLGLIAGSAMLDPIGFSSGVRKRVRSLS